MQPRGCGERRREARRYAEGHILPFLEFYAISPRKDQSGGVMSPEGGEGRGGGEEQQQEEEEDEKEEEDENEKDEGGARSREKMEKE